MAAPETRPSKHERVWDAFIILSLPVGALLGVSTFVTDGIWSPAGIAAAAYIVAGIFVGGYVGAAGRKAANHNEAERSEDAADPRRPLTWAGAITGLALLLSLLQDAVEGGVPGAIFWIGGITVVAIGLAITTLSFGQRQ